MLRGIQIRKRHLTLAAAAVGACVISGTLIGQASATQRRDDAGNSRVAGTTLSVLLTGYGWWDNTPAGSSEISNPVIHQTAGGTGTYADPITVAVPYHCGGAGGAECLQW